MLATCLFDEIRDSHACNMTWVKRITEMCPPCCATCVLLGVVDTMLIGAWIAAVRQAASVMASYGSRPLSVCLLAVMIDYIGVSMMRTLLPFRAKELAGDQSTMLISVLEAAYGDCRKSSTMYSAGYLPDVQSYVYPECLSLHECSQISQLCLNIHACVHKNTCMHACAHKKKHTLTHTYIQSS